MNKVLIAEMTREELIAFREKLWRQKQSVKAVETIARVDRRLRKMEESNAQIRRAILPGDVGT